MSLLTPSCCSSMPSPTGSGPGLQTPDPATGSRPARASPWSSSGKKIWTTLPSWPRPGGGGLCHRYGVPCLINDNLPVALAAGADGVHVGQEDQPVADIRRQVGPDFIIGATAKTS